MKKNQPLVSVIVNCFNGEKYLTKCLDSIKNQTYKNWEIIFWDNRSTDNSAIIFKSYKDKRFKYFLSKKKNVLYKGRNLAINKAKGKYIAFLDTDDFWDKNKLQEQIPKFKNKKIGLVYSNFFKFTKNQIRKIAYGFNLPSGNVTKKIIENYSVGFLTVVVKANLIKKKKKIFDYKYDLLADLDFILRLSLRTNFYGINKPLAYYRIHENQLQKKKMFTQAKQFCEWFKKKKIEENFKEFDLTNIINKYNYYDFIRTFNKSKIELLKKVIKNFSFKIFFKIIALIIMPNRIIKKLIHNV